MLTLPLILTERLELTPMEQSALNCETVITALMAAATLTQNLSDVEREGYTLLIAAVTVPAEA
jgi:branched-subunit amino acid transport protein